MKYILILFLIAGVFSCQFTKKGILDKEPVIEFGSVPHTAVFKSDSYHIWGATLTKGDDGLYHMFYSRWPKSYDAHWTTDSEIAHAISTSPLGPFKHKDVALPARGAEFWDGMCTHNPTIHKFKGKYYLY